MSHSSNVFLSNYQPDEFGKELLKLAFGAELVGEHDEVMQVMRTITLGCDLNAPTSLGPKGLASEGARI